MFTSKCAFRHSGVQFFDIWTSKSAPKLTCFVHFDFTMRFSPQRRAILRHLNFKKCAEAVMFCTFSLPNVLFATAACNFWFLLSAPTSAPAALTGLLFDWPDTRIIEKTQHFATSLTFASDVSSFFWLSRYCIFFLPTWLPVSSAFQLSILSEVCYLNFLRSLYNGITILKSLFKSKNAEKAKVIAESSQITFFSPHLFASVTCVLPHLSASVTKSFPHFSAFVTIFFPHFTGSAVKQRQLLQLLLLIKVRPAWMLSMAVSSTALHVSDVFEHDNVEPCVIVRKSTSTKNMGQWKQSAFCLGRNIVRGLGQTLSWSRVDLRDRSMFQHVPTRSNMFPHD